MSYGMGVVFACVVMAVIIGMVLQAVSYARGRDVITRRQLVLRLSAGSLLIITIGLMFYYTAYRPPTIVALIIWALMTLLPLVVIILAWMDLRQVIRTQHERQAELYRSLATLEQDLRSKPDEPKTP